MEKKTAQISEVLDALYCGAALVHTDGTLVHVNERLCEMCGTRREEIEGHNLRELYPAGADREAIEYSLAHLNTPREVEFFLPHKDGHRVPIIICRRRMSGVMSDYYISTLIDITERKTAEDAARQHLELVSQLSDTALEQAVQLKHHADKLEEIVKQRTEQLRLANLDSIYMLAVASEAKDEDTGAHVRRIQELAERLARRLGMSDREANLIGYSAVLHDIGKIHVPDHILKKPGPLDPAERALMQEHTSAGERILSTNVFFAAARRIARSHHENWDASGYPDALSGQSIPAEARIVHVVDVWDALTSQRVYKKPWDSKQAREFLLENAGKMFDREMVRAFLEII